MSDSSMDPNDPFINVLLAASQNGGKLADQTKQLTYAKSLLGLLPSYQKDYVPEAQAPYKQAPSSVRARYKSNPLVSAALDDVDNGKASSMDFAGALLDENGILTDAAVKQGLKTPEQAKALVSAVGDYEQELGTQVADKAKYDQTSTQHGLSEQAKASAAAENDPYATVPVHQLPDVPAIGDLQALLQGDNASRRTPWDVTQYNTRANDPTAHATPVNTFRAANGNQTADTRIAGHNGYFPGVAGVGGDQTSWVTPQPSKSTMSVNPDHWRSDADIATAADGLRQKLQNANDQLTANNARRPSKAADQQGQKMALLRMLLGG